MHVAFFSSRPIGFCPRGLSWASRMLGRGEADHCAVVVGDTEYHVILTRKGTMVIPYTWGRPYVLGRVLDRIQPGFGSDMAVERFLLGVSRSPVRFGIWMRLAGFVGIRVRPEVCCVRLAVEALAVGGVRFDRRPRTPAGLLRAMRKQKYPSLLTA